MLADKKLRDKIIRRIKKLSEEKLDSVNRYIDNLETTIKSKSDILSFAGIFSDLDTETFHDLSDNLIRNRAKGPDRIE